MKTSSAAKLNSATKASVTPLTLVIGLFIGMAPVGPSAHGDDQSSITAHMINYGGATGTSLSGNTGWALSFSSESRGKAIRPTFQVALEYSKGTNTLIAGQIGGGVGLYMFKTNYVSPFIGGNALLGWGQVSTGSTSSIALNYGGTLYGGAEIRFSAKPNAKAMRITTGYRILRGSFTSVSSLDALIFGIGIIF